MPAILESSEDRQHKTLQLFVEGNPQCLHGDYSIPVSWRRFLSEGFNVCKLYRLTSTSSPEDVTLKTKIYTRLAANNIKQTVRHHTVLTESAG